MEKHEAFKLIEVNNHLIGTEIDDNIILGFIVVPVSAPNYIIEQITEYYMSKKDYTGYLSSHFDFHVYKIHKSKLANSKIDAAVFVYG